MKKSKLNARSFKAILIFIILVVVSLSSLGFYFTQYWLSNISSDISNTIASSKTSNSDLQALKKLEDNLAQKQDVIIKTNFLLASNDLYQGQAIKDLSKYAQETGITISNYSFSKAVASTSTKTTRSTSTPSPQPSITLSVVSPISYLSLLKFLSLIESNLPKMQVSNVDISRINDNSESVKVDKLIIEVYTS